MSLRVALLVFTILFSFTVLAQNLVLNYNIYPYQDVNSEDIKKVETGLNFYNELLLKHCGIKLNSKIKIQTIENNSPHFNFDGSWVQKIINQTHLYFFRFFQFATFREVSTQRLTQEKNEVSFILTRSLTSHCGFAFPKIQFKDAEALAKNTNLNTRNSIEPLIQNRILFASPSENGADCANSNRMVSHELSHVLIQDEIPHHCLNTTTNTHERCHEENILATQRTVYPNPRNSRGLNPGYGDNGSYDPFEPQYVNATGTEISEDQCQSIVKTLQELQN
jgi:hypothetical protein